SERTRLGAVHVSNSRRYWRTDWRKVEAQVAALSDDESSGRPSCPSARLFRRQDIFAQHSLLTGRQVLPVLERRGALVFVSEADRKGGQLCNNELSRQEAGYQ